MTVLAALQSAALRLAGRRPQTFFDASGKLEMELCDLVNEVAQDIARYQDWQDLIRLETITGDGSTSEFDLPEDYDRFPVVAAVQDYTNWAWGYYHYTDLDRFLYDEASDFNALPGGWIIYGGKMRFSPAPSSTASARFPYITKNIVRDFSTSPKPEFTKDDDSFILPERLLTLGLVWRWRENKGLANTGDQEAFILALDQYASKNGGPKVIRRNSHSLPGRPAWPWTLGEGGSNYWPNV